MKSKGKLVAILLGPIVFLLLQLIGAPESMQEAAFQVLAITIWIAIWWISEAIPIAVTVMLPILLFPLMGALGLSTTTAAFGHKYVFLYLGAFMIAIAIEKWNLNFEKLYLKE